MATQQTVTMSTSCNKCSLEEISGLDQLVKDLSDSGITRETPMVQFSAKDFIKKSLYSGNNDRMQNVHSIFAAGLERRRRAALLGYDDDDQQQKGAEMGEPAAKRRRFQRRNSKTPAMLFKSMSFLPQDLFNDDKPTTAEAPVNKQATQEDDDDWDGGLEIAEQIVKHLQKRRISDVQSH
jgi:hypothetical protein